MDSSGARVQFHEKSRRNDVRLGFDLYPLSAFGFDLPYTVQDFLPHIALGLESGECHAGQLLTHFEMPPNVNPPELYASSA